LQGKHFRQNEIKRLNQRSTKQTIPKRIIFTDEEIEEGKKAASKFISDSMKF